MSAVILVVNAGSSSIKFSVYEAAPGAADSLRALQRGAVSGIGAQARFTAAAGSAVLVDEALAAGSAGAVTHDDAWNRILAWLGAQQPAFVLRAAGHRVVHGGPRMHRPTRVDAAMLDCLRALIPLAPLHQPHCVAAIASLARRQPDLPQVACFDTAFHCAQPRVAREFGLPRRFFDAGVTRYGFHGLSYESIAHALPQHLGAAADGRVIVAHLGNGASLCAMQGRRSVATTMSLTPLDGLLMSTRCGTIDPGVVLYLMREYGMDAAQIEHMLYYESGLLGVSGVSGDMAVLLNSSDPCALQAVELFVYRVQREIGSLAAALGGVDTLVFTGGIGENAPSIRERVCAASAWLGVSLDRVRNRDGGPRISADDSAVSAWVLPAREDDMMAQHVLGSL